jgi:type IV secretion system protein VirD4
MSAYADHPFKDIYRLPKPWKDTSAIESQARNVFLVGLVVTICLVFQHLAHTLRDAGVPWVGKPDLLQRWYSPVDLIQWWPHLAHLWSFPQGKVIIIGHGVIVLLAAIGLAVLGSTLRKIGISRLPGPPDTHGSARVATPAEIERAGFFSNQGHSLGYAFDSRGRKRYVRTKLEGHTLVVAPTGSGKTTAYVYQLLTCSAKGSVFVYDIKGENYDNTSGFRSSAEGMNSKCLRLSLSDDTAGNAHFNPLDLIRVGTPYEYADAQDEVEVLIDPEGKGNDANTMSEGHFQTFANSLLIAGILFVKHCYPPERQNLAEVLALFSDTSAENTLEILSKMRDVDHDKTGQYGWLDDNGRPTRKNKYIVAPATDIILMTEEARSSMLATCKRYLKPYRNPIVAAATSYSDFDIIDLVDPTKNISLYLVVAPSSKDSLKPVSRLIINMILKKLTERRPAELPEDKRLQVVLDEFDTLGKLPAFVDGVQFFRGYGMDCHIIIQGYNQLFGRYGQHEMITGACTNVLVFTPNDDDTNERVSKRMGEFTIREKQPSAGEKQKDTYRDYGRRLLYPDEVGRIPIDRALAFVAKNRPMYLWKQYAHNDEEISYRTTRPTPIHIPDNVRSRLNDEGAPDPAADFALDKEDMDVIYGRAA